LDMPELLPRLVEDPSKSYGDASNLNMLIRGDNLPAMQALIELGFAGTVDCVQIDPPYNTGYDFGDYSDDSPVDEWKANVGERLAAMHTLLAPTGFLLCHINDSHSHDLRNLLDETFGRSNYWATFHVNTKHADPSVSDESPFIHKSMEQMQVYRKGPDAQPFLPGGVPMSDYVDGASLGDRSTEGGVLFRGGKKPEALIRFGFEHFSRAGALVLDAYLGSGTGAAVAAKTGRDWIGISRHHMESHCLPRLRSVVDGSDNTGISADVGWTGGSGFRYYDVVSSSPPQH
jgi:adenine specific DNA methylase Mod